jgi:arylformamidase
MRIVDLTMTWPDVPTYPGHPEPTIHRIASFETHGKQVSKLEIGTHSGTHIDAPRHYVENGATVDQIPLDALMGPALLLDLTGCNGPVTAENLQRAAELRFVPEGSFDRILLRYDGHKRLGSMDYYFKQPWLTEDAARWVVRYCKLIGMDTPMPDGPDNIKEMPVH